MALKSITVVRYQPSWQAIFSTESTALAQLFGELAISIHHIGSTSIPEMHAKPIIDILIEVRELIRVDALNPALAKLGYSVQGENGLPGRRYFIKGGDTARRFNVHVFERGHPEIRRCLDFRDFLRTHPDDARIYSELKQDLARKFPTDIDGYVEGKDPFIKETLARARAWRQVATPAVGDR